MSKFWSSLLHNSPRENEAERMMERQQAEHENALVDINKEIRAAKKAELQSSAAHSILKRLIEDIPK